MCCNIVKNPGGDRNYGKAKRNYFNYIFGHPFNFFKHAGGSINCRNKPAKDNCKMQIY